MTLCIDDILWVFSENPHLITRLISISDERLKKTCFFQEKNKFILCNLHCWKCCNVALALIAVSMCLHLSNIVQTACNFEWCCLVNLWIFILWTVPAYGVRPEGGTKYAAAVKNKNLYINSLVQNCSISSILVEIWQSCTKPSINIYT